MPKRAARCSDFVVPYYVSEVGHARVLAGNGPGGPAMSRQV